jgi:glycosyltransferase involved in cell wall biosynthesis
VMPSDYEGMPNAMMEAMAAGLPCVSTSRSGARDVARDQREALYYEPHDTAALVEHLVGLLNDPTRARALGAAAQLRIQEFAVSRFVERFEALLDEITTVPGVSP